MNFSVHRIEDLKIIEQMKNIDCSINEFHRLIGLLTSIRVAKDSKVKSLKDFSETLKNSYPLNQSQISQFTEDGLLKYQKGEPVSLWDIYNLGNEMYKADRMEIPNLIPQNLALVEVLKTEYNI